MDNDNYNFGFCLNYNHKGIIAGFYSNNFKSATLGDYLHERAMEDLKIMKNSGEVKTYKLSPEELESCINKIKIKKR